MNVTSQSEFRLRLVSYILTSNLQLVSLPYRYIRTDHICRQRQRALQQWYVTQRVIAAYRADIQSLTESNAKVVDALVTSIRRRQIIGSLNVALATGALIQNIVRTVRYNTVDELISVIKAIGRRLMDANPRGMFSLFRTGGLG